MNHAEFSARIITMKDKIFRFARSIVSNPAEAEDVMQDVFEKLWKNRDVLGTYDNLEAFVMVSVRNLCYDRLRHRQMRHNKIADLRKEMPIVTHGVVADHIDTADTVRAAMDLLPDKQRMVMHLRDIEGYEFEEIAAIIGMEEPTVRVLLSRARKAVRERITYAMNYGTGR